jgi:hypothetical protein
MNWDDQLSPKMYEPRRPPKTVRSAFEDFEEEVRRLEVGEERSTVGK